MDFWLQMAFAVAMLMDEVLTIARVIKQKQPQRIKNYAIGFHIVFILMLLWLVVAMIQQTVEIIPGIFSFLGWMIAATSSFKTLKKMSK